VITGGSNGPGGSPCRAGPRRRNRTPRRFPDVTEVATVEPAAINFAALAPETSLDEFGDVGFLVIAESDCRTG